MKDVAGPTLHDRIQSEVQEIADVLSRRSRKPVREVWEEALSLHRVRYETDVLEQVDEPSRD